MKRLLSIFLMFALFLCGCGAEKDVPAMATEMTTEPTTEATTEPTTEPTTAPTEPPEEHFTITFTGDCTLGTDPGAWYATSAFVNVIGADYGYPFRNVVEYFENDDCTIINLEGVFADEGYPAEKQFRFRGPTAYVNILTQGSVEAVTLANNHSYDFGRLGYEATTSTLTAADIPYAERNESVIFRTESGLTIGMYGILFTFDWNDLEQEIATMKELGCDVIILAVHWGSEGFYYPLSHQKQQAYQAIDMGVDIVYGNHSHTLQPIEEYGDGIIYYSLGNFSFGGNHNPPDKDTAILQQEVIRDAEGNTRLGELTIIPACVSSAEKGNNFQPTPYEEGSEEYDRVISKLDGSFDGPNLHVAY